MSIKMSILHIFMVLRYFIRMFIDFSSLATSIGIGGFLGFLMGYAMKKIVKIIIIVAGLIVGIIYYLQYNGLIALNWAKMEETMGNLMTNINGFNLNTPFFPGISDQFIHAISASGIPLTGGFAAGFAFGISKG